ncbi:lytic transglycosylase domain-containing protein [Patescibacteria group bacterium]|nr:lytic transglycosylase domain-containing protein [Patescibacteria group bacterium]MBU0777336.1 lytic transglycosylase domain-containing protein [Patescibacteria group bacterium]MBU0846084.1 lytic transglycosylase domain-containing protein [Patescibacteria group bacterium]MBU0923137.1 lytic transglycosylase domain-containing protein [Patescibacteria group bacterium]MBU1066852.1 lytic transglycosylase domain-containing protein [Patescibacteria group bacterium]
MFRKIFLVAPLLMGFLLGYFGMSFFGEDFFLKGEVLSEYYVAGDGSLTHDSSLVMTPSPTPSPTSEPTQTPKPTSTPSPSPTPIQQPVFSSEEIHGFIERFAGQYGVDPNVLRHLAVCESGFNPLAIKLNYAGLFQFSPNTWIKYRLLMGEDTDIDLRLNAEEAVQTAAYAYSIGHASIWPNCAP